MTSCEEKKALPSAEVSPGGVYPDEIEVIKKKAREGRLHRLRIPVAVAGVSLVILAVVGGTLLGLHLNRKPAVLTRSVHLVMKNEIIEETVEVDTEQDTEIFRTANSNGTSYVIRDMKKGLSAYKFEDDEKCYILESLEETEGTEGLMKDLGAMEEGEFDAAEGPTETYLTADEARGQVDRSALGAGMAEFCSGLETHWAVQSPTEPTPTPTPAAEAGDEDGPEMEEELPETNGTDVLLHREKRSRYCCRWCWPHRRVCGWERVRVCPIRIFRICIAGWTTEYRWRCSCVRTRRCCRWGWRG